MLAEPLAQFDQGAAYDAFEHLWRSINSCGDRSRLMAMFTVYFDESEGQEDAYSVGGYVATVEQWQEFNREWREMLKDEGISELHKANLESLRGEYGKKWEGLSKDETDIIKARINRRACGIILRRVNAGFATAVKKSDWLSLDKDRWGYVIGDSFYAAGVKACMALVSKWMDKFYPDEWVDYVFETGNPDADEVNKIMLHTNQNSKEIFRLGSWSFASKKNTVGRKQCNLAVIPLQAADFIAYETYREMGNRIVEGRKLDRAGNEIPRRKALRCILQHTLESVGRKNDQAPTPHYMFYFEKEDAERVIGDLNEMADQRERE